MSNIRQNIRNCLELSSRVQKALAEFFKGDKEKDVIAQEYFSSAEDSQTLCNTFETKINIMKDKTEYLEKKKNYENAIEDVYNKILDIPGAVKKYKYVNEKELCEEYKKFLDLRISDQSYIYDKSILDKDAITFQEEIVILEKLNSWKTNSSCACRLCALEYLFHVACTYAKEKIHNLASDMHKQVDEQWLYEFETRHSEKFSSLLLICKQDYSLVSSASPSPSSFNITNISKLSILSETFEEIELESNPVDIQKLVEVSTILCY